MKSIRFVFFLFPLLCNAQKHDFVWVTGDNNQTFDTTHGGLIIDFNFNPPHKYYNYRELNFRTCNASICDSAGNLLFYTNGCSIAGTDDEIIENGEGLNPGNVYQQQCVQYNWYNSGYQSSLILPVPDSSSLYFLFHKRLLFTFTPFDVKSDKLFYSSVDMSQNGGTGEVIAKNVELMTGSIAIGEMAAVKHANGKDWWLVTPKRNSNEFYRFLFTKEGIVDTMVQTIGDLPRAQAEGGIPVVFSPDGSKFFRSIPSGPVMMYDFDRTNGMFTDYDTIHVEYGDWPSIANGCGISPNGRYLYVSAELRIYQFDLWASDISGSQVTVAEWDGFQDPVGTLFGQCQLGPDCKMYVCTIDSRYYHVINNPDEPGLACNVTQHSFIFPTPTGASMPFFPNYRLGPIDNPGVPCTAVVSVSLPIPIKQLRLVQVHPNPASSPAQIHFYNPAPKGSRVVLYDLAGRLMLSEPIPEGIETHTFSLKETPSGWYFVCITENGRVIAREKLAVLR